MTTSTQNLLTIAEALNAAGKEVKIRRLPTAHGTKANRYADRIRGGCLLYTSPSPRDKRQSRMPSSA